MFITLPLALIGGGYLIYLLFGAASYALPLIAALSAGFAAAHAGASGVGALLLGIAVFMLVIAVSRMATLLLPSHEPRMALILLFAVPAAITGYQVAFALLHFSGIGRWGVALAAIAAVATAAVAAKRPVAPRV